MRGTNDSSQSLIEAHRELIATFLPNIILISKPLKKIAFISKLNEIIDKIWNDKESKESIINARRARVANFCTNTNSNNNINVNNKHSTSNTSVNMLLSSPDSNNLSTSPLSNHSIHSSNSNGNIHGLLVVSPSNSIGNNSSGNDSPNSNASGTITALSFPVNTTGTSTSAYTNGNTALVLANPALTAATLPSAAAYVSSSTPASVRTLSPAQINTQLANQLFSVTPDSLGFSLRNRVLKQSHFTNLHKNLYILVVDDSIINAKVVANMLRILGVQSDKVSSGKAALDRLHDSTKPHITHVITDINMPPGMSGLELAAAIMNSSELQVKPELIGFTASPSEELRQYCIEAGIGKFLSKPTSMDELTEILELRKSTTNNNENNDTGSTSIQTASNSPHRLDYSYSTGSSCSTSGTSPSSNSFQKYLKNGNINFTNSTDTESSGESGRSGSGNSMSSKSSINRGSDTSPLTISSFSTATTANNSPTRCMNKS